MLLEEEGCTVIGPVPNVKQALDALSAHPTDAATLDLNLNGESSASIADALRQKSIPFIVITGYSGQHADPAFREAPLLRKPFNSADLLRKLASILT